MNGLAIREPSEIHLITQADDQGGEETTANCAHSKTKILEKLALKLLLEAQSLTEVIKLDVRSGIDFYEEVKRFEVDLIQRALWVTGGNQARAAHLLRMKVTTLNSKIKHYGINIAIILGGYEPREIADAVHHHA